MRKAMVRAVLAPVMFWVMTASLSPAQAAEGGAPPVSSALSLPFAAGDWAGPEAPVTWRAPENPMFYDKPLMLRQYGYGVLANIVAGSLLFYIGNAFEGAIFGGDSHKGYLSFTGIRYEHKRGPFWGGGAGVLIGGGLTVFFVGDSDEEPGSVWATLAGGALTTVAAFALADAAGVQEERGMLAFVPLLALPPLGAVGGYHVSRWFNDRKRRRITEPDAAYDGPVLHAPRIGMAPGEDGMILRMDALRLTF